MGAGRPDKRGRQGERGLYQDITRNGFRVLQTCATIGLILPPSRPAGAGEGHHWTRQKLVFEVIVCENLRPWFPWSFSSP